MVAYVKSYTAANVEYAVHVDAGVPDSCSCKSRLYRTSKPCKHMLAIQEEIQAEVDRATRFLAVKAEIEAKEASPRYSEVCGHLVRRDTSRHCGCMA